MWAERLFEIKRLAFLVFALLIVGGLAGLPGLSFTTDNRVYYDEDNPRLLDLESFEDVFLPSRFVVFGIASETGLVESEEQREALRELSSLAEGLTRVRRVDSLSTVSHAHGDDDTVTVEPVLEYVCPLKCIPERLEVLRDPVYQGRLVSVDFKMVGVVAAFDIERGDSSSINAVAQEAVSLKRELEDRYPSLDFRLTGGIPISDAYAAAGRKDSSVLFALAGSIMFALLWVLLGSIRLTISLLGIGLAAVVIAMGIGGWFGMVLNSASATVPIVVMTLVIASSMHVFTHYLRSRQDLRDSKMAAVASLNANWVPIALTIGTTSVSLFSLSFIDSPPAREFGLLSALGVFAGGVFTLTIVPILLASEKTTKNTRANALLQRALNAYARKVGRNGTLEIAAAVGLVVCAVGISQLEIDDDFVAYLSDRTEVKQDTDVLIDSLSGPTQLVLHFKTTESVFDPSFYSAVNSIVAEIRDDALVSSVVSYTDIIDSVADAYSAGTDVDRLDQEELYQHFFLYQLNLRPGEAASDIVTDDGRQTHVTILLSTTSALEVRAYEVKLQDLLKKYPSLTVVLTGENIPIAHLSTDNIPQVISSIFVSLLATTVMLGIYFSNWRIGLNTLLAISIPIICGLGAWGWFSGSIGLAGTIVVAIALGIVIDDAIHLLYQQSLSAKRGDGAMESAAFSVHRVGVPIVATSVVFVLGLSPLLFSDFGVNITFATCTTLIVLISLVFDLSLLPRLMTWSASNEFSEERSASV